MGKSGWLPDISYNFGYYRTLAVNSLAKKEYINAMSSLYTLNGCLGEDYLVTISDSLYNEKMESLSVFLCNHCTMTKKKTVNRGEENEHEKEFDTPHEVPISTIKIFDMLLTTIEQSMLGEKTTKAWICPKCDNENKLMNTRKVIDERERPFFNKVIYTAPMRTTGLSNRLGFLERFTTWFWDFLEEINWQEVLYRKEYTSQHDGQDMEFDTEGKKS